MPCDRAPEVRPSFVRHVRRSRLRPSPPGGWAGPDRGADGPAPSPPRCCSPGSRRRGWSSVTGLHASAEAELPARPTRAPGRDRRRTVAVPRRAVPTVRTTPTGRRSRACTADCRGLSPTHARRCAAWSTGSTSKCGCTRPAPRPQAYTVASARWPARASGAPACARGGPTNARGRRASSPTCAVGRYRCRFEQRPRRDVVDARRPARARGRARRRPRRRCSPGGAPTPRSESVRPCPMPTIPTPTDHPYGGFSSDVIELLRAAHSSTPLHQLLGLHFVSRCRSEPS